MFKAMSMDLVKAATGIGDEIAGKGNGGPKAR